MEQIVPHKPRSYAEALRDLHAIIWVAQYTIDQGFPVNVAQRMFKTAVEGLYVDPTDAGLDQMLTAMRTAK